MRAVNYPHTVVTYHRAGRIETMTRPGHLPARAVNGGSVDAMLAGRVSGPVTVLHHNGDGALAATFTHEVV